MLISITYYDFFFIIVVVFLIIAATKKYIKNEKTKKHLE
jgi:hypothetical protein